VCCLFVVLKIVLSSYLALGCKNVNEISVSVSAVLLQFRFVTEIGWFGVVRVHPKSLEIAPFDRAHMSFY